MSSINGIHSWNPCRFIGVTVGTYVKRSSLEDKITVLALSIFWGAVNFCYKFFYAIPLAIILSASIGVGLIVFFI